jgi:DNA primase
MNEGIVSKIIYSKFDLPTYMQQFMNIKLQKLSEGKFRCLCPFPYHRDSKPSFSLDYKNGGWLWYCYGCGEGGMAINFFQKCFGMPYDEAVSKICEAGSIKTDLSSYLESMGKVFDTDRDKKEIEESHIRLSGLCRNYLRDYPGSVEVRKYIKSVYDEANVLLDTMDSERMQKLVREVEAHMA